MNCIDHGQVCISTPRRASKAPRREGATSAMAQRMARIEDLLNSISTSHSDTSQDISLAPSHPGEPIMNPDDSNQITIPHLSEHSLSPGSTVRSNHSSQMGKYTGMGSEQCQRPQPFFNVPMFPSIDEGNPSDIMVNASSPRTNCSANQAELAPLDVSLGGRQNLIDPLLADVHMAQEDLEEPNFKPSVTQGDTMPSSCSQEKEEESGCVYPGKMVQIPPSTLEAITEQSMLTFGPV